MKGFAIAFSAVLIAACSACGGGGGSAGTDKPVVASPKKPVEVLAAGDSTMAGLVFENGAYVITYATTIDLQADLQSKLGPTVTVTMDAESGGTLQGLLTGATSKKNQTYAQTLALSSAQIVIENFSLNDENKYSAEEFRQYLITFITQTQQAGKIPVLEEPNPGCNPKTGAFWEGSPNPDPFVVVVDEVAQQYGVALIQQWQYLRALPNICTMFSDNALHPTRELYAIKAQREADVLIPMIQKLQN